MSRSGEKEVDLSRFRENFLRFRQNLRRALGLPQHGLRLRSRLVKWRQEEPLRARRVRRFDERGRLVREEIYAEGPPIGRERPEHVRPPSLPDLSLCRPTPPAPESGEVPPQRAEERRTLADALQRWVEFRREYSLLWNLRRAVKGAVEKTKEELELEVEERRRRLKQLEEEERRRRFYSRGEHY